MGSRYSQFYLNANGIFFSLEADLWLWYFCINFLGHHIRSEAFIFLWSLDHCWNPDREWCYLVLWCTSRVPIALTKQILRKTLGYCLSGISFNGFCHSPPVIQPPYYLGCFQRGIGYFYYLCYCVCIHKVLHEILENWHSQYHVRWLFAMIITILAICVCYLYGWPAAVTYPKYCCLRKCLHYSDLITVNMESISFCLKLKSIVLLPSVFPSSFISCTILLCSLAIFSFFSFIAFLSLEQLPCL